MKKILSDKMMETRDLQEVLQSQLALVAQHRQVEMEDNEKIRINIGAERRKKDVCTTQKIVDGAADDGLLAKMLADNADFGEDIRRSRPKTKAIEEDRKKPMSMADMQSDGPKKKERVDEDVAQEEEIEEFEKEEKEALLSECATTAAVDVVPEVDKEDRGEGSEKPHPEEPEIAVEDTSE